MDKPEEDGLSPESDLNLKGPFLQLRCSLKPREDRYRVEEVTSTIEGVNAVSGMLNIS